jgi:superfamily II DNA/RNA helicase
LWFLFCFIDPVFVHDFNAAAACSNVDAMLMPSCTTIVVGCDAARRLMTGFGDCTPDWMATALRGDAFKYPGLLPVQAAVVPYVNAALDSGIHVDICLSAPTGSGKTLSYLIPALRHIARQKARFNDTQLRAVVLVPTGALGKQVAEIARSMSEAACVEVGVVCGTDQDDKALVRVVDGARSYSAVDLVVATPQKLHKVLSAAAPAVELRHMAMLVIDEADEVLGGTFTNFASRIASRMEAEVRDAGGVLHKMLASATLTTRIAKVADVELRNAKYFALDTGGNAQEGVDMQSGGTVRNEFVLPATLQENLVIVEDARRHAVLLKIVRHVRAEIEASLERNRLEEAAAAAGDAPASSSQYSTGQSVLVFCGTTDSARVLSHFLAASGIPTLEFTATATEAERRRAVLRAFVGEGLVVVATDALMRGIDMPGVRAVVMYDAPRSMQQYIHRIGRTARANTVGHSYILAAKLGPSGTQDDGEVKQFLAFDKFLRRASKPAHDRALRAVSDECMEEADGYLQQAKATLQQAWATPADVTAAAARTANQKRAAKPAAVKRSR